MKSNGPVSFRWRFAIGLLIGLLVGLSLLCVIFSRTYEELAQEKAERSGIVKLLNSSRLLSQTGISGDAVRQVVNEVAASDPGILSIRVIRGPRLEASTAKEDSGDKAAPRRLSRDEKPLFDLGQRLRAAVQTNREEQVARKQEIEIYHLDSGALRLAAPVEQDDSVVGFVLIETAPPEQPKRAPILAAVLAGLIAFAILIGISFVAGQNKTILALSAFVLLIAAIGGYGIYIRNSVRNETQNIEKTLAKLLAEKSQSNTSVLAKLGIQPSISPSSWDADLYRRPRGSLTDQGQVVQKVLQSRLQEQDGRLYQLLAGILVITAG
ncbi:MAG TPA: hypothetical protein VLH08_20365, partial [Acidobacteriota bacterium]|nr:hypothetical protein [Acidobacteriota bacterium]